MPLEILTPLNYTNPYTGSSSNIFAAHNKNRIRVQRKDFEIGLQQDDGSGNTVLKIVAGSLPTLTIGGKLYSNIANGLAYTGAFQIIDQPAADLVTISAPFLGDFGYGFINLLTDYKGYHVIAELNYEKADGSTGNLGEATYTPFSNGLFEADFSTYAKQTVSASDFAPGFYNVPTNRQWADNTIAAEITFRFSEKYNGIKQEPGDVNTYMPINAAMDYTHKGGANIWECFAGGSATALHPVRFFRPAGAALRLWKTTNGELGNVAGVATLNGAPSLTFHMLGISTPIQLRVKKYRGGNSLGTIYKGIALPVGNPSLPAYNGGDSRFPRAINTYLQASDLGVGVLEADSLELTIVDAATQAFEYSETITARVSNCIPRNPILIKALNSYGGYEYFVFGVTQTKTVITKSGGTFTRNSDDFTQIEPDEMPIGKNADVEWTMGADDIYTDELPIIETILSSPVVWMRQTPAGFPNETPQWAQVKIAPGSFVTQNTKSNRHKTEFKVQLASLNLQTT